MNDHADLELIAAFREGLLDQAAGEWVGRHLSGCTSCAQHQSALDEVTVRLAEAPELPLPPVLARRLDAVLAAEVAAAEVAAAGAAAAEDAATETAATGPAAAETSAGERDARQARQVHRAPPERAGSRSARREPARRERAGREPARRERAGREPARRERAGHEPARRERAGRSVMAIALRPLAAAASICLLAGGGYLLAHTFTQHSPVASTSARSAGKQQGRSGAALSPRMPMHGQSVPAAKAVVVVRSGTTYQRVNLGAQAAAVARRYAAKIPSPAKVGNIPVQPFRISPSLSGCLLRVTGGIQPLVVDMAAYQGHQAMVIIAPGSSRARGHVWVVDRVCSASSGDVIATSGL
jgi:hypothetical protein